MRKTCAHQENSELAYCQLPNLHTFLESAPVVCLPALFIPSERGEDAPSNLDHRVKRFSSSVYLCHYQHHPQRPQVSSKCLLLLYCVKGHMT